MKDPVVYDTDKYHAELVEFDRWFEENEEELKEEFFLRYSIDPEEDDKLWQCFLDMRWQGR